MKALRNPILEDIKLTYDKTGSPKDFLIPAGEIIEVEDKYAPFVTKKIYNAVVNYRNINGIALEADQEKKKKLLSEIEMEF